MVGLSAPSTERQTNSKIPDRTSGSPLVEVKQKRCFAGIDDPMQHVCRAVHHGSSSNFLNLAVDGNLTAPFGDYHELFFGMLVRRVGSRAGIESQTTGGHCLQLI